MSSLKRGSEPRIKKYIEATDSSTKVGCGCDVGSLISGTNGAVLEIVVITESGDEISYKDTPQMIGGPAGIACWMNAMRIEYKKIREIKNNKGQWLRLKEEK